MEDPLVENPLDTSLTGAITARKPGHGTIEELLNINGWKVPEQAFDNLTGKFFDVSTIPIDTLAKAGNLIHPFAYIGDRPNVDYIGILKGDNEGVTLFHHHGKQPNTVAFKPKEDVLPNEKTLVGIMYQLLGMKLVSDYTKKRHLIPIVFDEYLRWVVALENIRVVGVVYSGLMNEEERCAIFGRAFYLKDRRMILLEPDVPLKNGHVPFEGLEDGQPLMYRETPYNPKSRLRRILSLIPSLFYDRAILKGEGHDYKVQEVRDLSPALFPLVNLSH